MVKQSERLDALFRALASGPRRAIVAGLAAGEQPVGRLAAPLDMSPPAVSKHLRVLEAAGVVTRRIEGRSHHIALQPEALDPALRWLRDHAARWSAALDALGALVETEREGDQ